MIKILSFLTVLLILFNVLAYDANHDLSMRSTEQRTRIIAGVPAHDKDYKLQQQAVNSNYQENSNDK